MVIIPLALPVLPFTNAGTKAGTATGPAMRAGPVDGTPSFADAGYGYGWTAMAVANRLD